MICTNGPLVLAGDLICKWTAGCSLTRIAPKILDTYLMLSYAKI